MELSPISVALVRTPGRRVPVEFEIERIDRILLFVTIKRYNTTYLQPIEIAVIQIFHLYMYVKITVLTETRENGRSPCFFNPEIRGKIMCLRLMKVAAQSYKTRGISGLSKHVYARAFPPKYLLQTKSFWYQMQGYPSVSDTTELVEIPPDKLTHRINTNWLDRPFPKEFSIRGGDWDEKMKPFEEDPKFRYIMAYHENGEMHDRDNFLPGWEKSRTHRKEFEQLYDSIKKNGYKLQHEIHSDASIFDEINVCIARDGTIAVKHGHHRASIAKVLELDVVPAYVRVRHEKWQRLRDEIWGAETVSELSEPAREKLDNPDMHIAFQNGGLSDTQ